MFGHSDRNHELLQERFKLGYQNYTLPETLGQWSFFAHCAQALFLPAERCQLQTFGRLKIGRCHGVRKIAYQTSTDLNATQHAFTRDQYLKNVRNRILEKIIIHFLY